MGSCCGLIMVLLLRQFREWKCALCGAVHDHDRNAANNIVAVGQTVTAQGDRVTDAQPLVANPPVDDGEPSWCTSVRNPRPSGRGGCPWSRPFSSIPVSDAPVFSD